jgi:hypothetical protein
MMANSEEWPGRVAQDKALGIWEYLLKGNLSIFWPNLARDVKI